MMNLNDQRRQRRSDLIYRVQFIALLALLPTRPQRERRGDVASHSNE